MLDIPMFRTNTAAFVHELPAEAISNVNSDSRYIRVQLLANSGALDRAKQIAALRSSPIGRAHPVARQQRTGPGFWAACRSAVNAQAVWRKRRAARERRRRRLRC
ncbi:MAG: hypothetical protein ACRDPL_13220 [Propionibacteriaceae bacterium]